MKTIQYVSPVAILCLVLSACGGGDGTPSYTVTAAAGAGGSLSPASAVVTQNETTTLTVAADTGYSVDTVSGCGGSLSGDTYTTGAVTGDCTVTASFTLNRYTVSASAGTGGAVNPANATVDYNGTTSFTVTPSSGYAIDSVSGCGGSLSGSTYTTGAVTANCSVTASFIATHTVSTSAGSNGSISPASATVNDGSTTSFTVTPDTHYGIGSVSGCGGSLSGSTYTTGAVTADCTVTASFALQFTWVSGSDVTLVSGIYGTQGTPASTNVPGGRHQAVSWTDASGNLWLFGGIGVDSVAAKGRLNDLWEYSPSTGEWTWMSGADTTNASGVYGTKGTAASTNVPGARFSAATWTDASGNLWLFGGHGYDSAGTYGDLNDLWKYDIGTGEWTWVGGANTVSASGVYGSKGTPASTNVPGARNSAMTWVDASGNLWLFGGSGYDSVGSKGVINDLWVYSPSTGQWSWESGSNTGLASGVYGTQGAPASTNVPGARQQAISWTDASANLWLFGGRAYDSTGALNRMNDLWEYDIASGEWTWMGGSDTVLADGVYGTQGTPSSTNIPGARQGAVGWTDTSGNLWLFGGLGHDSGGNDGPLNGLWEYNISTGEWTWIGGSNTIYASGSYGTQGTASSTNIPGARYYGVSWADTSGNLWLLGGYYFFNDLWSFHP